MKQEKESTDTEKSRVLEVDKYGDLAMNIKSPDLSVSSSNENESLSDYGFEIGDMVWGKVKSHPWWPGHIYNETLASSSVRRSKREGCILVAFFGDSSYGWFDLAELVPFDSHFAEKAKQTSSRTFVKAVAEAVDEASRRSALGLSCRCRNKENFREMDVKGYFEVDVEGYEPGGVYSVTQIAKARDGFRSRDFLEFVEEVACGPTGGEHVGIHFVKNKAVVSAYRKAVFEEFDETYAEAFGHEPVRPARRQTQDVAQQSRAPLSGRLVMAETLGKRKITSKFNKSTDRAKKDKYLFKRRDENKSQTRPSSTHSIHAVEGQKTFNSIVEVDPTIRDVKKEKKAKFEPNAEAGPTSKNVKREKKTKKEKHAEASLTGKDVLKEKSVSGEKNDSVSRDEKKEQSPVTAVMGYKSTTDFTEEKPGSIVEGVEKENLRSSKEVPEEKLRSDVEVGPTNEMPSLTEDPMTPPGFKLVEDLDQPPNDEKPKARKRPVSEKSLSLAKMIKKKKKKKKFSNKEVTTISDTSTQKKNDLTHQPEPQGKKLLNDLKFIAETPFHVVERNSNWAITRGSFLKFRSLVFQKSLPPENPSAERDEIHVSSSKPLIKTGVKRGPSDRQEEMAAKKKKKISDIKSLTEENKVTRSEPINKSEVVKKPEPDPTMLVMKFPPQGTLPSINELKAKFARFGPIDHSGTRVFWKSSTCRVIYLHKMHARAAYKFAVGSSNLFGNANVRYYLRDMNESENVAAAPVVPQAGGGVQQLKSCLKKSDGNDTVAVGGGNGTPRVKFKLGGGEESSNSFGDNVPSSSTNSVGVDINSKDFQKNVIPPPQLPPILPLPSQYARPPPSNVEAAPQRRNSQNINMQNNNVDISQQMMILLKRCNDVVANVTSFLGYVPYHPL